MNPIAQLLLARLPKDWEAQLRDGRLTMEVDESAIRAAISNPGNDVPLSLARDGFYFRRVQEELKDPTFDPRADPDLTKVLEARERERTKTP